MTSHHRALPEVVDISGERFGKLVALQCSGFTKSKKLPIWLCLCDCGRMARVASGKLRLGAIQDCGCVVRNGDPLVRANTKEYDAWRRMISRCTNPRLAAWSDYGGRGILVLQAMAAVFR